MGTLVHFLSKHGINPASMFPFSLIRSYFGDPGSERTMVDEEIGQISPGELAAIQNHPRYYVTSGTMCRHLFGCGVTRRKRWSTCS